MPQYTEKLFASSSSYLVKNFPVCVIRKKTFGEKLSDGGLHVASDQPPLSYTSWELASYPALHRLQYLILSFQYTNTEG